MYQDELPVTLPIAHRDPAPPTGAPADDALPPPPAMPEFGPPAMPAPVATYPPRYPPDAAATAPFTVPRHFGWVIAGIIAFIAVLVIVLEARQVGLLPAVILVMFMALRLNREYRNNPGPWKKSPVLRLIASTMLSLRRWK